MKSALAFAALTTPSGSSEEQLYKSIVEIPHYESKWMQLLDRQDEESLVADNLEGFRRIYRPLIENEFAGLLKINSNDCFELVDESDYARH